MPCKHRFSKEVCRCSSESVRSGCKSVIPAGDYAGLYASALIPNGSEFPINFLRTTRICDIQHAARDQSRSSGRLDYALCQLVLITILQMLQLTPLQSLAKHRKCQSHLEKVVSETLLKRMHDAECLTRQCIREAIDRSIHHREWCRAHEW